jgi:hypothetical protein
VGLNHLGQPIGDSVSGWKAPPLPPREMLQGRYCRVEPLESRHVGELWDAYAHDTDHHNWTYLLQGPYATFEEYAAWAERSRASADPLFFAVVTTTAVGVAAYRSHQRPGRSRSATSTFLRSCSADRPRPRPCI